MIYIVNVSGGLTSYEAERRTVERYDADRVFRVFADTLIEDNDLYRFLIETHVEGAGADLCARALALPGLDQMDARKAALAELRRDTMARAPRFHWLADGRTPFDVWRDTRAITLRLPNGAEVAGCTRLLKRECVEAWRARQPGPHTLVFGMDWSELDRMRRLVPAYAPTPVWFPLAEPPYVDKCHIVEALERRGIEPPRLYAAGFEHNNCGGGCVKAGQGHWARLWRTRPDVYAVWEGEEEAFRQAIGKDIAILKDRRGGQARPMTLRVFRDRLERGEAYDAEEWGGCGCFANIAQERMDLTEIAPRTEPRPKAPKPTARSAPIAAEQGALDLETA